MPNTSQVAKLLKCKTVTIRSWAIKKNIGTLETSRYRTFTDAEVELLRNLVKDGPGNPRRKAIKKTVKTK